MTDRQPTEATISTGTGTIDPVEQPHDLSRRTQRASRRILPWHGPAGRATARRRRRAVVADGDLYFTATRHPQSRNLAGNRRVPSRSSSPAWT